MSHDRVQVFTEAYKVPCFSGFLRKSKCKRDQTRDL